jgi:hypothetical protein
VVAVTPDGQVHVSDDAGLTWQPRGRPGGQPYALTAVPGEDGPRVVVVTDQGVRDSHDGATSFGPLLLG